ncbi:MAG: hypothetical protein L7F77_01375 [Candidatus Magnetominusculus sp. LBB02]|nr:hypothetical protein [Candidatus Magnetominusculus sp. LBB02]
MSTVIISIFSLAYLVGLCVGPIQSNRSRTAALAISCLLTLFYAVDIYSDRIIIVYFMVPAILTCLAAVFAGMVSKKKVLPFMMVLVGGYIVYLIMGFILTKYINIMPVFDYLNGDMSLHNMLMNIKCSFESDKVKSIALFTAWFISILIFFSIMSGRWKKDADGTAIAGIFYFFLCSVTIAAYLLTQKLNFLVPRYFALPAYLFVIIAFANGLKFLRNILYQKRVIAGIIALMSVVIVHDSSPMSQTMPAQVLSYNLPLAQCLDNLKDKYNLSFGLSDYWNSKPATIFSKKGIRLYALTKDLKSYHWINNIDWYTGRNMPGYAKPFYNFIVVNSLDSQLIEQQFGKPTETLSCPGNSYEIYFYDAHSGFNEKVGAANRYAADIWDFTTGKKAMLTLMADYAYLSQQPAMTLNGGSVTISHDDRLLYPQLFAAFSIELPKGRYRATLNFSGDNLPNGGMGGRQIGLMDIESLTLQHGESGADIVLLNTGDIVTEANAAHVSLPLNFTITKGATVRCVIYYTGVGEFTINSLVLERAV